MATDWVWTRSTFSKSRLVVSKQYGLQLRAGDEDNHAIFQSLRSLSDHIAAQRTK